MKKLIAIKATSIAKDAKLSLVEVHCINKYCWFMRFDRNVNKLPVSMRIDGDLTVYYIDKGRGVLELLAFFESSEGCSK